MRYNNGTTKIELITSILRLDPELRNCQSKLFNMSLEQLKKMNKHLFEERENKYAK